MLRPGMLRHAVQATEGGLQVPVLFGAEAGELDALGGIRECAQHCRLLRSPARKGCVCVCVLVSVCLCDQCVGNQNSWESMPVISQFGRWRQPGLVCL